MDLNHINVWLVETDGGCVIVDTGMAVQMGKEAWEAIERETFATQPVRAVFVTHIHPDHIGLAAWLQERYRVPVLMSRRTHEMMRDDEHGRGQTASRSGRGLLPLARLDRQRADPADVEAGALRRG